MPRLALALFACTLATSAVAQDGKIVHDSEYYVLEAQNGKKWSLEDEALDERLAELKVNQLGFLVEEYGRRFPEAHDRGTVTWCFDEIQAVAGWERFVRRLLDTGNCEVIVTGSSAALLSREVATAMRGRAWEVPI